MAANDHSATPVVLSFPKDATTATAVTAALNSHSCIEAWMSAWVAHRSAIFVLVEKLERELGRGINVQEVEARMDCEFDGRTNVTAQEAIAILASATPWRAISR